MRMNEVDFGAQPPIEGYGPGFFRVGTAVFQGPMLMLPDGARAWAGLPEIAAILETAEAIDVLFVGMGPEIAALDRSLRGQLEAVGIGVEIMATPSACRTYNVLLSEGRRVAAALMPV